MGKSVFRIRWCMVLSHAIAIPGCIPPFGTPPINVTKDFSNFETFEYSAHQECPVEGFVFSAVIEKEAEAQYRLELTVRGETLGDCGSDAPCTCYNPKKLPSRLLGEDEIQQVRDVFSHVHIQTALFNATCAFRVSYRSFGWDGRGFGDSPFACGWPTTQFLPPDQIDAIESLLSDLRE